MPAAEMSPEYTAAVQHLFYGHGNVPGKSDFEFAWKAVKVLAAADGELSSPERLRLLGKMCAILTPADVVDIVMQYDEHAERPEELLARVNVPAAVRPGTGAWIAYEALSVALADGDLADAEQQAIRRAAAGMGVPSTVMDALVDFCRDEAALRERRIELLNSTIPTHFRFGGDADEGPAKEPLSAGR